MRATDPGALLDEGAGHALAGRLGEAERAYRLAVRADPRDFRAPMSLATLEMQRGRPDAALPWLERAVAQRPDHYQAQQNLGAVAQRLRLWDLAAEAYGCALALRPGALHTRQALAAVLALTGRLTEAEAHHRVLAAQPATRLWALTRLALLRPAAIGEAELDDMCAAAGDVRLDAETAAGLWFAAGEVLEGRGRDEAAFEAFARGNRMKRDSLVGGPETEPQRILAAHAQAARHVCETFDRAFLEARVRQGLRTEAPIFIVGMPRSGSTLIQQILSAHPDVTALGETAELPRMLEGGDFAAGGPDLVRATSRRYLEAVRRRGWKGAGRFVDKTLENFLHVGAIAVMFPRARIVHAVRDPMDTCLSCWRQLFATGAETLYDFAEIGAEYRLYRAVMDHWRSVLPERLVEVRHEALVAEPEAEIRRLVTGACGLSWDDACLASHAAAGPVRTASAAQVRQPIFATSVGRWRRHAARLGPLRDALGAYAA